MNTDIGELFQQIHFLKNELDLACQESAKQAEEIEKDKEEIRKFIEKRQYLINKIEAKMNKNLYLEESLRAIRVNVEYFRQFVEKIKSKNADLKEMCENCRTKLEQESLSLEEEVQRNVGSGNPILNSVIKMKEDVKEMKDKIEITKRNIVVLEAKKKVNEEVLQIVKELEDQCTDDTAISIDVGNQLEEIEKEGEDLSTRKTSLQSLLQDTTSALKSITSELEKEKENCICLSDYNSSLRAHYDIVRKQPPIPRRRALNFQYNVTRNNTSNASNK